MRWGRLVGVVLAVGLYGCDEQSPVAPAPVINNFNITNNNNNNNGVPANVPPGGATSNKPITTVTVHQFGEQCPAGSGPADWTIGVEPRVHRGCTADITYTPRDEDGNPVSDTVHGPRPDYFVATALPAGTSGSQQSNPFNYQLRAGSNAGAATLVCAVKGVISQPWTIEVR